MRLVALSLAAALALTACHRQKKPEGFVPPQLPQDSCDTNSYLQYLGQPLDAMGDLVIPEPKRIIPAGAPVGMDYNPVRLNFDIDTAGNISRIWCG